MSLGESQPVDGGLGQVVEDGKTIARCVVIGGAVSHLDEQAAGLVDEEREKVMRSDEVGVNGEPEYSEPVVEVVLPYGSIPLLWSS